MLKFLKRKNEGVGGETSGANIATESQLTQKRQKKNVVGGESSTTNNLQTPCPETASEKYPSNPGNRPPISTYHPNVQDELGDDTFVAGGFRNWGKKEIISKQQGSPNSAHNKAQRNCDALLNQKQHIEIILSNRTSQDRIDYRIRLSASIGVVRILLKQGLPFHGHDESEKSNNRGNFLEILEWLCGYNEDIKAVTQKNAPENWKLTSPDIQKDIVNAISIEIVNRIASELGDSLFAILVDESRNMSSKEQMVIVLRYMDAGKVIDRFVGIEHVTNTNDVTLKAVIDDFLSRNGLSISRLRGQGYEGASNMRGDLNGLKTLILNENKSAFYVHCFAHQLQLALVAVAKNHTLVSDFFTLVANVVNVVGASAKRHDIL